MRSPSRWNTNGPFRASHRSSSSFLRSGANPKGNTRPSPFFDVAPPCGTACGPPRQVILRCPVPARMFVPLRCHEPRGEMSCGSPMPRGEPIAKPAEWEHPRGRFLLFGAPGGPGGRLDRAGPGSHTSERGLAHEMVDGSKQEVAHEVEPVLVSTSRAPHPGPGWLAERL